MCIECKDTATVNLHAGLLGSSLCSNRYQTKSLGVLNKRSSVNRVVLIEAWSLVEVGSVIETGGV